MRVTRRGVFETNSSSTHTIALSASDIVTPDRIPLTDDICVVFPGEFGWGVEHYNDAPTKASYCLTYAHPERGHPQSEELMAALRGVLEEEAAAPVEFRPLGDFYPWGYIDHQSDYGESDVCGPIFEGGPTSLRQFIFNAGSVLIIDNDNRPR